MASERLTLTRRVQTLVVSSVRRVHNVDVQVLVASQCSCQKLYLLVTLDPSAFSVLPALSIAVHLIQLRHLLNAILILLFHAQLKFQLRKHELNSWAQVYGVVLDKVCKSQLKSCEVTGRHIPSLL